MTVYQVSTAIVLPLLQILQVREYSYRYTLLTVLPIFIIFTNFHKYLYSVVMFAVYIINLYVCMYTFHSYTGVADTI